jgi:hypothetical protein
VEQSSVTLYVRHAQIYKSREFDRAFGGFQFVYNTSSLPNNQPIGMRDYYDFDSHGDFFFDTDRPLGQELATRGTNWFSSSQAKSFRIIYP